MSRRSFSANGFDVVVGYDPPLDYFFAQVERAGEIVAETALGVGVPTIELLAVFLKPYAELPADLRQALQDDKREASEAL